MRLAGGIIGKPSVDPFERATEARVNGRLCERNTELTVRGIRGRCRFLALVTHKSNGTTHVECVDARGHVRAFTVDAVTTVHRLDKLRENEET